MNTPQNMEQVLQKIKNSLQKYGASGIRGLGRTFRLMNSFDGNTQLNKDEFIIGLKERGVDLKKQDIDILFHTLDSNRDGSIDFNQFLIMLRGEPNALRQQSIHEAFRKFDAEDQGYVNADDLRGIYDVSDHPKVQRGEMTQSQVFLQFLQNFSDKHKDGTISWQEFYEYYSSVSSDISNDEHFQLLLKHSWRL